MYSNVFKCIKMYSNLLKCIIIPPILQIYQNVLESILIFTNTSKVYKKIHL